MTAKKENNPTRRNILSAVFIFLTSSLLIGLSDLLISILFTPRFPGFIFMLKPLAITVMLFFPLQILLYMIVVLPVGYFFKTTAGDFALLLASFFVFFFITGSAADLFGLAVTPEQAFKVSIVFVVAVISAAALAISIRSIREKEKHKQRLISSARSLPFIFAEILLFFCLVIYGTVPFLTAKFLFIGFLFVLLILFTLWMFNFVLNAGIQRVLVVLSWLAAVFSLFLSPSFSPGSGLKNIPLKQGAPKYVFLVTVDCLRADAIPSVNPRSSLTPHIDQLAGEAVIFTNAFSPSSWTLPAVVSLMTGISPPAHTVTKIQSRMPDRLPTIAGQLTKNGYHTCAIGINPNLNKRTNVSKGFLSYDFYPKYSVERAIGSKILKHFYRYYTAENVPDLGPENVVFDWGTLITSERLTDLALQWVAKNKSKHFFLWLHYLDPHVPYAPPLKYLEGKTPVPPIGYNFDKAIDVLSGAFVPGEEGKKWMKTLYDGEVRYVDDNLGRLFKTLKEMGIYNDSLVILTSDHGEEFWDHGGYYHGHSMYNEVLSVPLIIKPPGGGKQERVETRVSLNNIMPTILEYCQIPREKKEFYAGSLLPFLRAPGQDHYTPRPLVCSGVLYGEERQALFFDRYKYIIGENSRKEELFDLAADPAEQNSLNEKMPDRLQTARELLKKQALVSDQIKKLFKLKTKKMSEKNKKKSGKTETLKTLGYL